MSIETQDATAEDSAPTPQPREYPIVVKIGSHRISMSWIELLLFGLPLVVWFGLILVIFAVGAALGLTERTKP